MDLHLSASPTNTDYRGVRAVLAALAKRLEAVGDVMGREHSRLKPQVDFSRATDDARNDDELRRRFIDQEQAEQEKSEDKLVLRRSQVDKHLKNLLRAEEIDNDIATYIKQTFRPAHDDGANG